MISPLKNFLRIVLFLLIASLSLCRSASLAQQRNDSIVNHEYTIAFLLPFNANKVYIRDLQQSDFYLPEETQIAVAFYEGALLALDSLAKQGFHCTVLVFDIGNDSASVNAVLSKPQLREANLIIGPLSGYALKAASAFSNETHIPLISPLSAAYISDAPNQFFILANATLRTHCEAIYDYLLQHEITSHVLLVYRKKPEDLELVNYLKDYRAKKDSAGYPEIRFIEFSDSSRMTSLKLRDSLFITQKNIIVVPSNEETFVRSILKKAAMLHADYNLEVIGMPTWINFDALPAENLDSLKTLITSSFWLDKTSWQAQKFQVLYFKKYGVNPMDYAVRGYDEMYYFGLHLMQLDKLFISVFPPGTGLSGATAFNVVPVMEKERDVWYRENKSIFFLQHDSGAWKKIKP
jgi:hypothetical protein